MNGIIWLAANDCDDPYFGCTFDDAGRDIGQAVAGTFIVFMILVVGIIVLVVRAGSHRGGPRAPTAGPRRFAEEEWPYVDPAEREREHEAEHGAEQEHEHT